MIKAILFDMDGTLVDSERYYTEGTYEWIREKGFKGKKEDLYPIIGTTMDKTAKIIKELLKSDLSIEDILKLNEDYFYNTYPLSFPDYIFPEVKGKLHDLKEKGYRLALCSASPMYDIKRFIKTCDLQDIFELVESTDNLGFNKPDGRVYSTIVEMMKLKKDEVIVVEDSYSGILAGKNAKIITIARKDYRFNIDQSLADYFINDLDDIDSFLGE